jgi:hypothetical protein
MESNLAHIHISNFDKVFMSFHGISTKYAVEILEANEYDRMNAEMDEAFGLKFLRCQEHEYVFEVKNKHKYLMAKILYGA